MKKSIIPFYSSSDRIVEKSLGCFQYDSEGKKFIDFESGVWCSNLGHSHPRIVSAINEQSRKSLHSGYRFRNRESEQLSLELLRIIGFEDGASVFLSSGSEAVDLSIKIAKRLSGKKKKKILKIRNSYLSAYGYGELSSDNPHVVNAERNDFECLDRIDFSDIAVLVLELGGASVDTVRFPAIDYVQKLAELCRENSVLVIAEEVTTGMGRLGTWFGFQTYGISPDMVVTGKALGNGYPVSAVTVNYEVLKKLKNDLFIYAQSHQNDPLGCAVGVEVIKTFEEEHVIENCLKVGECFKARLQALKEAYPNVVKEVRAQGLMLALEFCESTDGSKLNERLFKAGFVVGYKQNTMRFLPPLTITEREIDMLIAVLDALLKNEYALINA